MKRLNVLGSIRSVAPLCFVCALLSALFIVDVFPRYFAMISISATREKSPEARNSEVWLLSPTIAELRQRRIRVSKSNGWIEKNGNFISVGNRPALLEFSGWFPSSQTIRFLKHPWSGEVEIEINHRKFSADLFQATFTSHTFFIRDYLEQGTRTFIPAAKEFARVLIAYFFCFLLAGIFLHPLYSKLQRQAGPVKSAGAALYDTRKSRLLLGLLAGGIVGIFWFSFYPGVLNADSYLQYSEAVTFQFDDWFPPMMSLLWAGTNKILRGAGGLFGMHLLLIVLALYLLSDAALKRGKRFFFSPMFFMFLPFISCLVFVVITDVSLAVFLFLAFSIWYHARASGRVRTVHLILVAPLFFYAFSVRHNAPLAVIPIILLILLDFTSRKKAVAFTIVIAAMFYFVNDAIVYRLLNTKRSYNFQSIMAHDLMGIYAISGRNYFPQQYLSAARLDQIMPQYDDTNLDSTTWIENSFLQTDPLIISSLMKAWLTAVVEQPVAYIRHRWTLFHSFLDDPSLALRPVSPEPPSYAISMPMPLMQETALGRIHTVFVGWILNKMPFVFRALSFLIASLIVLIISLKRRIRSAFALSCSALLYGAAYFFVAPEPNYRYGYWTVVATILSVAVIWIERWPDRSIPVDEALLSKKADFMKL